MQDDPLANLPYQSYAGLLEYQAQNRPNQIFLLYPDVTSDPLRYASATFAQLNRATNRLATTYAKQIDLTANGQKQIVVGLLANSSVDYLVTQMALMKLGVVVFSLSTRNSKAALEHLIKTTGVSYLIVGPGQISVEIDNLKTLPLEKVDWNDSTSDNYVKSYQDSLECDQMIFHSSGSTAFPKPIYYTNRSILNTAVLILDINPDFYTENDTVLTCGVLFHILAFGTLVTCLTTGATYAFPLVKNYPPTPKELLFNIQIEQINKMMSVPILVEQLVNEIESVPSPNYSVLTRLQFIAYGGAPLPDKLCHRLVQQGVHLVSGYGSTETNMTMMKDLKAPLTRWKWMKLGSLRKSFVKITSDHILIHLANDPFTQRNIANQPDGSYSTFDILIEDPPGSGEYHIEGRQDDTLIHSNGEKTNPIPMEQTIRLNPLVRRAHIFGHQRLCTGVLIELERHEADSMFLEDILDQVWEAIEVANETAPTHSRIVRQMVKCLPLSQSLPTTDKGNTIRKRIEKEYADVINDMYRKFLNPNQKNDLQLSSSSSKKEWNEKSFRNYIKQSIVKINPKISNEIDETSKSLFDIGFDSLHAVQLRNEICSIFPSIPVNFIYEYSSIDSMVNQLITQTKQSKTKTIDDDPKHYKLTESLIDKYAALMSTDTFAADPIEKKTSGRVFLVTGANGSLGSWIILDLLKQKSVSKVYCLYRGQNKNRIIKEYEQRLQSTEIFNDDSRVILLNNMILSDELLGQDIDTYNELCQELTDVIHSAYRMDFNLTVRDFEKDGILGTYNLLKLTRKANSRFHFISSVASQGSGIEPIAKEEPAVRRPELAIAQGYGQSKYVCEHLGATARRLWGTPVDIYRVGQISGDSKHGAWNTTEMISLIICVGGGELGQMPSEGLDIDWIPVDIAASAIVEIALQVYVQNDCVHHILNPNVITWSTFLQDLKAAGLQFEVVDFNHWMENVLKSNTALVKLSSFFGTLFTSKNSFLATKYETKKTKIRSKYIESCPIFNVKFAKKYLSYWYNIGFLTKGYQ